MAQPCLAGMRVMLASVLLAILAPATAALAQPAKTADVTTMVSDDCAKARKAGKTCVLTIEDETVEGGTPTFTETNIVLDTFGNHGSLINLRRDFIPEILRTAEDID